MPFLLDTNICIYIANHQPPEVRRRLTRLPPAEVAISMITLGELRFGAERSARPKENHERIDALAQWVQPLALDQGVAEHYGQIVAGLRAKGRMIGLNDAWIAAHARAMGWTLVTNNESEFRRVPRLKVENWVD